MSMYNFLEWSSNYSDTTGSLWFYSKNKAVYSDIDDKVAFNTFLCSTKLVGETEVQITLDNNNKIPCTLKMSK